MRSIRGSPTRSIRDSPTRSIRGSPTKASDEESEWSSHRFSGSSSPLSAAEELHERSNEKVVEKGKVVDEQGNVESCEYVENDEDEEEEDLEEEDGEEFTVMGRHGALISLVWGASALYVLLIRAKVQLLSDQLNMILPGGFVRGLFVTRRTGSLASSLFCSSPHPPSSPPCSSSSRCSLCTPQPHQTWMESRPDGG